MVFKLIFCLMISSSVIAQGFLEQKPEGWNWYKEPPKLEKRDQEKKILKPAPSTTLPLPQALTPMEQLKALQKDFDDKMALALFQPTLYNVQAVQALQRQIFDRATTFGEMWMLAGLMSGDEAHPQNSPNPMHRRIWEEKEDQSLEQNLKVLAKEWGLFLAFQERCPYCQKFAPIVGDFSKTYGFSLLAISKDKGSIKGLKTVQDNGLLQKLNPQGKYPALFLVNYASQQIIPLAWGLVSLSDLKDNARRVLHYLKRKEVL